MEFGRTSMRLRSAGFIALALSSVVACDSNSITRPDTLVPLLVIVAGGGENQIGTVGTTLPLQLIVQVTAASGSANGQILNFVVTSGGGSVFANVVQTGTPSVGPAARQSGIGQNTWTLGPSVGPQTVEARLVDPKTGATLTEATFHATAVAGAATSLQLFAGDRQSAVAGTALAVPPAVLVTDQTGNPIPNVNVTFNVASGAGSISGSTQIATGANGVAAVGSWTLGATAGPNTLTATTAGLVGSPITFRATGVVGAPVQIVAIAGSGQLALTGSTLAVDPAVRVRDFNGNGVGGVAVTFTVTAGGGDMAGITSVTTLTNQSGNASVGWTVGSVAGSNTLRATALGLNGSPVIFGATAVPPLFVANQTPNTITIYDPLSDGNASPLRTIVGPVTGLNTPASLMTDALGQLYVTNYTSQSLTIFSRDAVGNAVPIRTISGTNTGLSRPFGLTRDAAGQIYVFDYATRNISVFASDATGNASPIRVIGGGNTGLAGVPALRFGPAGELYAVDQDAGDIKVFAAGASGNVTPIRTIRGPSTGLVAPGALEFDASGQLFVANFRGGSVTVYAPGASGDAAPVRTIAGANTGLSFPTGVALSSGQLYVSNYYGSVTVYPADANGNATPSRKISGGNTGLNNPGGLTF